MRLGRVVASIAIVMAACGSSPDGTVLVSTASSLTDVFAAIESEFEAAAPDVDVVINTGASSTLREQILAGAPVDVFAPADTSHIDELARAGLVSESSEFASNRLVIVVPAGNPGAVSGLADFARNGLLIGLCVPAAPCGELARTALSLAGIEPNVVTEESNVRALLTKVAAGELDAAIVYATDVLAEGATVEAIPLPPETAEVRAVYGIALLSRTDATGAAADLVAFVLSPRGRALLDEYGFESP